MKIPDDFPREMYLASVAGAQPKFAVRRDGDRYTAFLLDDERQERYEACKDLAQQLAEYCERKARENPEWTAEFTSNARREVSLKRPLRGGTCQLLNNDG